jgi:hypothetical protein
MIPFVTQAYGMKMPEAFSYKNVWSPVGYVLISATLFGISTPLSKILVGDIPPVLLVSFLYLDTALGMFLCLSYHLSESVSYKLHR